MLFIAPQSYTVERSLRSVFDGTNCKTMKVGLHQCIWSEIYTHIALADGHALVAGKAFIDDAPLINCTEVTSQELDHRINNAVGFFTVVTVTNETVSVSASLYRNGDIFYWNHQGRFFFSDSLDLVRATCGPQPLNKAYLRDFALDQLTAGPATALENINQVELGTKITLGPDGLTRRSLCNVPQPSDAPYTDLIAGNLRRFAADHDSVIIKFSGGIDSSLILAVANQELTDFHALHVVTPEESDSTEIDIATQAAAQLNCDFSVLHSTLPITLPRSSFKGSKTATSPFDIYPFSPDPTDRSSVFEEQVEALGLQNTLFISGQGGDNVFIQNPPSSVICQAFRTHGPAASLRELLRYRQLKNMSLREALGKAISGDEPFIEGADQLTDQTPTPRHLMLNEHEPLSPKFYHINSILDGLHQHETYWELGIASLHPLLLQDVVAKMLIVDVRDSYTHQFDRIQERSALFDAFKAEIAWRRSKKASSGVVFQFLRNNRTLIKATLLNKEVCQSLEIDPEWLAQQIDYNATVALTSTFGLIINLLRLQIFCDQKSEIIQI